jgi:oxygen-independent coproporphyrinogen-3 oxidase
LPLTEENLSLKDKFNEKIMTGLRTSSGVSLNGIKDEFGSRIANYLEENSKSFILSNDLYLDGDIIHVTKKSKFLSDGIASDLFIIDL